MCVSCGRDFARPFRPSRRTSMRAATAVRLGFGGSAEAREKEKDDEDQKEKKKKPPKPQNVLSPDAALERLRNGNTRYVEGVSLRHDFRHEREALAKGQNPYAAILSCADSRIAPEYAFDSGRGDLFVCRVAGNFANDESIASLEYAVAVLSTPLVFVLGHDRCGAVDPAIKSLKDNTTLPGHMPSLVAGIHPSVKAGSPQRGDTLGNAIPQNVIDTVAKLSSATPILSAPVDHKKLSAHGRVYRL